MPMLIAMLLFLEVGRSLTPTVEVDMIEINHCKSPNDHTSYSQVIAWDWMPEKKAFVVRQWWMLKDNVSLSRVGEYRNVRIMDASTKKHIIVRSKVFKETRTTTDQDPERLNRSILKDTERIPLWELPRASVGQ